MKTYVHLIWPEKPSQGPEPRMLTAEFGHMTVTPGRAFRARDRHAENLLAAYPDDLRRATPEEIEAASPPPQPEEQPSSEPQDASPGASSLPGKTTKKRGGN